MARRAQAGASPQKLIGVGAALAAAIAGGVFFLQQPDDEFEGLSPLPVEDFMQNANSLRGNEYQLQGTLQDRIGITNQGELISLLVRDPDGRDRSREIPIMIPADLETANLERQRDYAIRAEVNSEGIPVAQEIKRK